MNIITFTPAVAGSKAGNRATAVRYRDLLRSAGYNCRLEQSDQYDVALDEGPVDCVIVLHAIRGRNVITEIRLMSDFTPERETAGLLNSIVKACSVSQ